MTQPFGIDTSVLVRLTTREPEKDFEHCVEELRALIEDQGNEIFASNQVIGEAYVAIQHHYGVSDSDTRASLIDLLTSGLVCATKRTFGHYRPSNHHEPGPLRQADCRRILTRRSGNSNLGPEDSVAAKSTKALSQLRILWTHPEAGRGGCTPRPDVKGPGRQRLRSALSPKVMAEDAPFVVHI